MQRQARETDDRKLYDGYIFYWVLNAPPMLNASAHVTVETLMTSTITISVIALTITTVINQIAIQSPHKLLTIACAHAQPLGSALNPHSGDESNQTDVFKPRFSTWSVAPEC